MTTQQALRHPFITQHCGEVLITPLVAELAAHTISQSAPSMPVSNRIDPNVDRVASVKVEKV
jgi:hypothetical protein